MPSKPPIKEYSLSSLEKRYLGSPSGLKFYHFLYVGVVVFIVAVGLSIMPIGDTIRDFIVGLSVVVWAFFGFFMIVNDVVQKK